MHTKSKSKGKLIPFPAIHSNPPINEVSVGERIREYKESYSSELAEIIWEKGTNRTAFFRGEVDKYGWVDTGSSFLPSEIIAAFLFAQLEHLEEIQDCLHMQVSYFSPWRLVMSQVSNM